VSRDSAEAQAYIILAISSVEKALI